MNYIQLFAGGFGNNILITILAAIIPLCVGIPLSLLFLLSKRHPKISAVISAIISAVNIPFVSILFPAALLLCYYGFVRYFHFGNLQITRTVIVVFALALTYWLYIPARYIKEWSFGKNTLYNSLGLLSRLFVFSFIGSYFIGLPDALTIARNMVAYRYVMWPYLVVLLGTFCVLFFIELVRWVIKTFMK